MRRKFSSFLKLPASECLSIVKPVSVKIIELFCKVTRAKLFMQRRRELAKPVASIKPRPFHS